MKTSKELKQPLAEIAGTTTTPDDKRHYRAIVTKIIWYCHKNNHVVLWNRMEDAETNSHIYSHLIFDKAVKTIYWEKHT